MREGQGQQSIANTPVGSRPAPEMGSHYLLPERYPFPATVTQNEQFSTLTRKDLVHLHLTDGEMMPLGVGVGVGV